MNKFKLSLTPVILMMSLVLAGCNQVNQPANTTYQLSDFTRYKGSYIGDNSAVGHILSMLPAHEYMAGFSLQTDGSPYEMTVHYQTNQANTEKYDALWSQQQPGELLERNAAVLFALVKNVKVVNFQVQNVMNETYTFTRGVIQAKYGNLDDLLNNQKSFNSFLQD